jgi:hypothetical protein
MKIRRITGVTGKAAEDGVPTGVPVGRPTECGWRRYGRKVPTGVPSAEAKPLECSGRMENPDPLRVGRKPCG